MNSRDLNLLNDMASKLAVYLPWDLNYEDAPILLLAALIERVKSIELTLSEIKKNLST
jgi:hypothetical protein